MISGLVSLLNWNTENVEWTVQTFQTPSGREKVFLNLRIAEVAWANFFKELSWPFNGEIQIKVNEGLDLFFKVNTPSTENKLMVAHPESHQWVATCALTDLCWQALQRQSGEKNIKFHHLGGLHFLSNLEMVWQKI